MSFTDGDDISLYVTSKFMKFLGFWTASTPSQQRWRYVALIISILDSCILDGAVMIDLYYTWGDIDECLYLICTIVTGSFSIFKIVIVFWQKKEFFDLIHHMQQKFFKLNYDSYEEAVVKKYKRICAFFVCWFIFCVHATVLNYALVPILVSNRGKTGSDRVLPLRLRVDWSTVSPYFEILFVWEVIGMHQISLYYCCFDCLLYAMNMNVAAQFRILQYRLVTMNRTSDKGNSGKNSSKKFYTTFKDYVRQHQALIAYCKELKKVFSVFSLVEVLVCSLQISLIGYNILMANSPTVRRFIFIWHIGGVMSLLFMFSYGCDCLTQESEDVATAMYSAPWANLPMNEDGQASRKDSMMVIMRSNTPCSLSACGFSSISLATYTKVMSTSISYFALLRQSAEDQ